jgi:N-acetylmuramoyl-L-alanine amidase
MSIIALDAGHLEDGSDPGACGNSLRESDLTGDIRRRVAEKLSAYVCDVRLVPRTDSLNERTNYANAIGADIFVSIHVNAGHGTGFESFFYPSIEGKAIALSNAVHRAVSEYLTPLGIVDRGKKFASFAVLKNTVMPAVLLECLFIDNSVDAEHLKNDTFLDGLSNAIAWGIVQALSLVLVAPDGTMEAVRALQAKGVIASPDYWLLNAKPGKLCDGSYVAALIRNMAGKIGG